MKVSDANTTNAAAVLGYQNVESMTMDDSPEFIAIFQKNLYQYHTLAFVRETLTNAWDAHIDAGLTDTPIEVSLSLEHGFTIKDRGFGIAPDMMKTVYGIIGRGTKAGDNRSTGGFGLGCKSPHGYVDAFQVESCYNGTKTIYQIVKASELTDGKPAIITIMSMPTEETGLTVTIPINTKDFDTINRYITMVVYAGDFPCMYTLEQQEPKLLETMQLSTAPASFIVHTDATSRVNLPTAPSLSVRYANIVYPLPEPTGEHEAYAQAHSMMCKWKEQLSRFTSSTCQIIIQAESGTLSIQPSRESLSASKNTLNVLCQLINDTFIRYNHVIENDYRIYRAQFIDLYREKVFARTTEYISIKALADVDVDLTDLVNKPYIVYNVNAQRNRYFKDNTYRNANDLVKQLAICNKFTEQEMTETSDMYDHACEKAGLFPAGWVDCVHKARYNHTYNWVDAWPILQKAYKGLDLNSLCSYANVQIKGRLAHTNYSGGWLDYSEESWTALPAYKVLGFAARKVVLTCNLRQTESRLELHRKKGYLRNWESCIIVYTPRNTKQLEVIRQTIIDAGYPLIDLSVWASWENKPVVSRKAAPTVTVTDLATKGKAYPLSLFAGKLNKGNMFLHIEKGKEIISTGTYDLLDNPEYVYFFERKGVDTKVALADLYVIAKLAKDVGDKIGVVFTKRDYAALEKVNSKCTPMSLLMDSLEARWAKLKPLALAAKRSELPSKKELTLHGLTSELGYGHEMHSFINLLYQLPEVHKALPFKVPALVNGEEVEEFINNLHSWERYFNKVGNIPSYSSLVDDALCARFAALMADTNIKQKPSAALIKFATQLASLDGSAIIPNIQHFDPEEVTKWDIEVYLYIIKLIRKQPYDKPTN